MLLAILVAWFSPLLWLCVTATPQMIHTHWVEREQSSVKYRSFATRDKTRPASLPSKLLRTERREETAMLCLWKVASLRKESFQHQNSKTIKTSKSCWCLVINKTCETRPYTVNTREITSISPEEDSWLIQRKQWSVLPMFLINPGHHQRGIIS